MNRLVLAIVLAGLLVSAAIVDSVSIASADDAQKRDIAAAFAPFEYLLGTWTGHGVTKDDPAKRFRGWDETHSWAWTFVKGKPTGLLLTIEGSKFLSAGKLTFDAKAKHYRLEGTGPKPDEKVIVFEGSLDRAGKLLALDRVKPAEESGKESAELRISLWPNANFIRYTMTEEIKEPGAIQFKRKVEIGLTKEGESLAGAATTAERPKCIVTGGAASMTLTHQGHTYPICCTGCLEEFNENPEKYIKKAALMLSSQAGKSKSGQPAASRVSRFEDAFAGDVDDSAEAPSSKAKSESASSTKTKNTEKAKSSDETESPDDKTAAKPASKDKDKAKAKDATPATKSAARAATLLRLGRSLEKDGKTSAALGYYRRIVKEHASTPSAKTAAERIKALDHD